VNRSALRVVVIADTRFPISEPFAGGMQSLTWHLVRGLRKRGVDVTVFAGPGTDKRLNARTLAVKPLRLSGTARRDVSMQPDEWMEQHHAYLQLMLKLAQTDQFDVVHNNSLHHLPIAMAETLRVPMVTTLHTPPTPWLEPVVDLCSTRRHRFVAVSEYTARSWQHVLHPGPMVVPNGVDLNRWPLGGGGTDLVWSGRIAPEKGAHLAIDIARAEGRRLRIAGPLPDLDYWEHQIRPRLGASVEYVGHLRQRDLANLVGSSAVCLVTPTWDEPYGLVAAEALACGTPVLGFARGGLSEVVGADCARLVAGASVDATAALLPEVERLDRRAARAHAEAHCSLDQMVSAYLDMYAGIVSIRAA